MHINIENANRFSNIKSLKEIGTSTQALIVAISGCAAACLCDKMLAMLRALVMTYWLCCMPAIRY
jgi:hypothetical protein